MFVNYVNGRCPPSKRLIAKELVDNVLCTAQQSLKADPHGYYFYKLPKNTYIDPNTLTHSQSEESYSPVLKWSTILQFNPEIVLDQIVAYIGTWVLSSHVKHTEECLNDVPIKVKGLGSYCNYLVQFFKPTEELTNPLARAKVFFRVYVSEHLPKHYPVMVTYNFEGFNTIFYALGNRALNSVKFQCFYIDTILEMKLSFYTEVFECTHAKDCPHCKPIFQKRCV